MTHVLTGANSEQQEILTAFLTRHGAKLDGKSLHISLHGFRHSAPEGFKLSAEMVDDVIKISLGLNRPHSLRYALNALLDWLEGNPGQPLDLEDGPDFPIRGVVEGFYGQPWSHQQRMRAIEFFGDFNMNSYFLAPKDDPLQRFNWRSPFAADFLAQAQELSEHGKRHGISFVVCVSPGLSVQYSNPADVDAVAHRYKQLLEIGITHFGLLWDDISWELSHPEDISTYPTTAAAQADFSNKVWDQIIAVDDRAQLTLCPMQYSGRGNEAYLVDLGQALKSRINIMWTGRQIISEYLDVADAVIFERSALRPALYWDNFPVNDGSLQSSLFIGPLRGRETGLHKYSAGLLSNPMVQFEASILPLSTVGDYLWDSTGYEPDLSWERSLTRLYPISEDHAAIRAFLRTTFGSPVGGDPAPDLRRVFNSAVTSWRSGDMATAAKTFESAGNEILSHHQYLTSGKFSNANLISEIAPWLEKFKIGGEVLIGLAQILIQCRFDLEKRAIIGTSESQEAISALKERLESHRKKLFGDQIEGPLNELAAELRTYS
jgi:hyaluronoglucosaminidase